MSKAPDKQNDVTIQYITRHLTSYRR